MDEQQMASGVAAQQLAHEVYQHVMQQLNPAIASAVQQQMAASAPITRPTFHPSPEPAAPSSSNSASTPPHPPLEDIGSLRKLLARPSTFHGERGSKVYDWLNELEVVFSNCIGVTEATRIDFAKQCLRGEALRWWTTREREVHSHQIHPPASASVFTPVEIHAHMVAPITTWEQFKQALCEYFCPGGTSESARAELHSLRQHQFRTLSDYCDRFQTVALRIEVPMGSNIDEELISTFKNGLVDGQIRLHLTSAKPKTVLEATNLALQAERDLRVSGYYRGTKPPHQASYTSRRAFNSYQSHAPSRHYPNQRYSHSHSSFHAPTRTNHPASQQHAPMDLSVTTGEEEFNDEVDWNVQDDEQGPSPVPDNSPSKLDDTTTSSDEPSETNLNSLRSYNEARAKFLEKNNCWNCGERGHFLIQCPKQRGKGTNESISSSKYPYTTPKPKKL
jgi:hypothetical protein